MKNKQENVFLLLGRLAGSIKNGNDQRSLELLEKVIDKVSQMDLDLPIEKREVF